MKRVLSFSLAAIALTLSLSCYFFINYLVENRPLSPDIEQGFLYPITAHGPDVYASHFEFLIALSTGIGAAALFLVAFFLEGKRQRAGKVESPQGKR